MSWWISRATRAAYSAASRRRKRVAGQCAVCEAGYVGLVTKRTCSPACRTAAWRRRLPGRPAREPWLPRPGQRVAGPRGLVGVVLSIGGDCQYTRRLARVRPDDAGGHVSVRVLLRDLRPA